MNEQRAPRVFVTQIPSRRDKGTRIWVPTVNIAPAEKFGELVTLLPPGSQFFAAKEVVRLIKERLHELDYQPQDYFLPLGSPVVMTVAGAIAARRGNGRLNVLVWDGHGSNYVAYELDNLV